jgi:hypothetical protein
MSTTTFDQTIIDTIKTEPRCPICALVRENEFNMLCQLQYDVTRDRQTRVELSAEGGFCEFHFRQFRKLANSKTNALLLLELIRRYCENNGATPVTCRVCTAVESFEETLVNTLADMLDTEAFRNVYAASGGVCIKHMHDVQARDISESARFWIAERQIEQMKRAVAGLEELATVPYYDTAFSVRGHVIQIVEKFAGRRTLGL